MLSKQTSCEYMDSPFTSARGQQMQWLQSAEYAKGMPEDVRHQYLQNLQTSIAEWETALASADQNVSLRYISLLRQTNPGN